MVLDLPEYHRLTRPEIRSVTLRNPYDPFSPLIISESLPELWEKMEEDEEGYVMMENFPKEG